MGWGNWRGEATHPVNQTQRKWAEDDKHDIPVWKQQTNKTTITTNTSSFRAEKSSCEASGISGYSPKWRKIRNYQLPHVHTAPLRPQSKAQEVSSSKFQVPSEENNVYYQVDDTFIQSDLVSIQRRHIKEHVEVRHFVHGSLQVVANIGDLVAFVCVSNHFSSPFSTPLS